MKYILPFFYDYVFPNFLLPNALPPELAVINYFHSQYSNKLSTESLFDLNLDNEKSLMKLIFDHNMGFMPNSLLMGGGTYLSNPCFKHLVKINFSSLYFGKKNTNYRRYVYPIKVNLHFPKFTGFDNIGSKQNGSYFWKYISQDALTDIKNNNAIIFLDYGNENYIDKVDYINLHNNLMLSGIPKNSVVLGVNSFNAQEIYESWFPQEERMLEVRNFPFLLSNISYHYSTNLSTTTHEYEFKDSKQQLRKNYFVFPIRRARDHRLLMLHKLASNDLLEKGDWSCLESRSFDDAFHQTSKWDKNLNVDKIKNLHQEIPHPLQNEIGETYDTVHGWNDKHSKYSINSYFYIASETYTHGEYKSLTEKVFKPIANFQPFFFIAYQGALKTIRSLGFKTFSPYIDEAYDDEPDDVRRIEMIFDQVKQLCSLTKEELHNWFWGMQDILIHNRTRLLELYKNEENVHDFVKHLNSKVYNS